MKRHALLIANADAAGAQNDINNWKKFLRSGVAGAWHENEIQVLANPSKAYLERTPYLTKDANYDFVIVVYAVTAAGSAPQSFKTKQPKPVFNANQYA